MPARRDHSLPATRTPPPASAVKTANAPITLNYMALGLCAQGRQSAQPVGGAAVSDLASVSVCNDSGDRIWPVFRHGNGSSGRQQDSLAEQREAGAAVVWRLSILIRLTLPSTTPEFQGRVSPLTTASWSCLRPRAKDCRSGRSPSQSSKRVPTAFGMNASPNRAPIACWARHPVQWAGTTTLGARTPRSSRTRGG